MNGIYNINLDNLLIHKLNLIFLLETYLKIINVN